LRRLVLSRATLRHRRVRAHLRAIKIHDARIDTAPHTSYTYQVPPARYGIHVRLTRCLRLLSR
jgi:hypothetical protein